MLCYSIVKVKFYSESVDKMTPGGGGGGALTDVHQWRTLTIHLLDDVPCLVPGYWAACLTM